MIFKPLHNLTPVYLHNMFCKFNTTYGLGNSINKLTLPKVRTEYLKRGFSYSGAALWNSLPQELRECKEKEDESLLFFFKLPHGNHVNQFTFSPYISMFL